MAKSRNKHSALIRTQALSMQTHGLGYERISNELAVPVNTLKKWFAPSVDRFGLASLADEQLEELQKDSLKLLRANSLSITESLINEALSGNVRAIIDALNRCGITSGSAMDPKLIQGNTVVFKRMGD